MEERRRGPVARRPTYKKAPTMDKKRAKLAAKAQTIEEIWESVSATKNGDLNPAPSRIVGLTHPCDTFDCT